MQKWYPEALNEFKLYTVFDLLLEYIEKGKIVLDPQRHKQPATYHDPCNYGRKSLNTFGHGYFEEGRIITRYCCLNYVEMSPDRVLNYCCGAGGGVRSTPFLAEQVFHGRMKARQIREAGAEMVVASCQTCRDQILKTLKPEFELDIQVKYLWELVADSLVLSDQGAMK